MAWKKKIYVQFEKIKTETLACAAQDQALRVNNVKHRVNNTTDNKCRMCGDTDKRMPKFCKMGIQKTA